MINCLLGPALLGIASLLYLTAATPADCRDDVRQLAAAITRRHPSPFRFVPEARFRAVVDSVEASCGTASASQRYFGLLQIAVIPGDSHTGVDVPNDLMRFPIVLNWFGDTLRVVQASRSYQQVLGARVVGVGDQSIERVIAALGKYVQQHENEYFVRRVSASLLTYAGALAGARVIASESAAVWKFATDGGEIAVQLTPVPPSGRSGMLSAASVPLTRQRGPSGAWYGPYPDDGVVFVKLSEYRDGSAMRLLADSVFHAVDAIKARKLAFDFRLNGGGNYKAFESAFLSELKRRSQRNELQVFVLIGRGTQSAPVVNAIQLKEQAGAILVGEPTGGRPNMLAEPDRFRLKFSGLGAAVSTHQHKFASGDPEALMPEAEIPLSWQDYQKGIDPVFDWIRELS